MKRSTLLVPLTLALALAAGAGQAHPQAAPGVDHRQAHQQARIAQGVASGALTGRETRALAAEQAAIRREERLYRADGVLGPWERADLHRDLNRASRHIARQKHDAHRRP